MASLIVRQGSAKMFEIGTMLKDLNVGDKYNITKQIRSESGFTIKDEETIMTLGCALEDIGCLCVLVED